MAEYIKNDINTSLKNINEEDGQMKIINKNILLNSLIEIKKMIKST